MTNHHQLTDFSTRGNLKTYAVRAGLCFAALAVIISVHCANRLLLRARAASITQNSVAVTSVSAASFIGAPGSLAAESIAAAFGTQLAIGTQAATSQPLPTSMLGTTVSVNGTAAPLFFVSPNQVNYLVPPNTALGAAQVVITSTLSNGDQIISRGEAMISQISPAIFTASANGQGAPAAVTGRINAQGQFVFDLDQPFEPDPLQSGQVIPRPIDVGSNEQPAFLILYGSGFRNAPAGSMRAIIGGVEVSDLVALPAPGFTGLDQVNIKFPTSLKGSGIVDVALSVNGVASNAAKVSLMGASAGPMAITSFSSTDPVLAGQTLSIQGSGFAATSDQNIVRFGPAQARVAAATNNQLTVIVPFGAESDHVTVQTPQNEVRSNGILQVRTSISGLIQSTGAPSAPPVPLSGVTVRLVGTDICVRTTPQGTFVMSDPPPGLAQLEIDGGTAIADPPFPQVTIKAVIRSDRDNRFPQPINLQQISGGSGIVGEATGMSANSLAAGRQALNSIKQKQSSPRPVLDLGLPSPAPSVTISDDGVSLDVPFGTNVRFPDGRTSGQIQLTVLERSRLPGINLPKGIYSPSIAQITPLGARFSPGAILRFPNPDPVNLLPGAKLDLYRYDLQSGSFIKRGTGTVSPDQSQIVSDGRGVDLASFWLIAAPGGTTTVTGRVVDAQGVPVPGTIVSVNGRTDTSDLNGGFSILDVSTAGAQQIQVDAVLPLQYGVPPRGTSAPASPVSGGVTNVGTIQLDGTNRPALVLSPFAIDLDSDSQPARIDVTLTQPAPTGGLLVTLSSSDTSVVSVPGNITIPEGQPKASFNLTRSRTGATTIVARATLAGNIIEAIASVTVSQVAPQLRAVTPSSASPGAKITISGTGLSTIARNNSIAFIRDNNLIAILDPNENEVQVDSSGNASVIVKVPSIGAGPVGIVATVISNFTGVFSDTSAPLGFSVLASDVSAPQLALVTPVEGKPRDILTISGTGFGQTPDENAVVFRQGFGEIPARVVNATSTSLSVEVPSRGITSGRSTIIARRISTNGGISDASNALDFMITAILTSPPGPTIAQVVNAANATSGRDGEVIFATGIGFGTNFLNLQTGDLANQDPLISLLLFRQGNQLVSLAIPTGATLGTQLTAIIPTGLSQGPVQITAVTYDLDTGLISNESAPVGFTITAGSLSRVNEIEPNDTPESAMPISIQTLVNGSASKDDPVGFEAFFSDGTSEPAPDLYRLTLAAATTVSFRLDFAQTGDLDVFLASAVPGEDGFYPFTFLAMNRTGNVEEFTTQLAAGDYLIVLGVFNGASNYALSVAQATGAPAAALNRIDLSGPEKTWRTGGLRLKGSAGSIR
ncbi:MAG TPA: IPT/TIG domain-containing protein [Blastocatellia bacterium]|nr:IPT/TIG domain-containing protein [Blastocatellia bacterium]